jgi:fused signal recognition particle receptor
MTTNSIIFIVGGIILIAAAIVFIIASRRGAKRERALTLHGEGSGLGFRGTLKRLFGRPDVGEAFFSDLEVALIEADAGLDVTEKLLRSARGGDSADEVKRTVSECMMDMLRAAPGRVTEKPHVVLVLGVNGVGKTTTIAKLAHRYKEEGKKVLLVACDTFRAAAVDQLKEWGKRIGCEVVAQGEGADAAAVAYDGVSKAKAKGFDVVIIDTAGRLHTKSNLMEELAKIDRVISRALPGAPHEKLLVIDSTVGANGLAQANEFHRMMGLTGAIVTKLDGTAKGGVVLAISSELGIPITHIGVGEKMGDLKPFDREAYVKTILG